jgi:2'-5' RNA ligase
MRLFVGLEVSPEVTRKLIALSGELKRNAAGARWTSPEAWHVTLKFLGEVAPGNLPSIVGQLRAVSASPFDLSLTGLGLFSRAGVVYAKISPSPALTALAAQVEQAMTTCGFEPERRPYSPHLTLARIPADRRSALVCALKSKCEAEESNRIGTFGVSEFLLFESFLGGSGSRYEVRERFPLASRTH